MPSLPFNLTCAAALAVLTQSCSNDPTGPLRHSTTQELKQLHLAIAELARDNPVAFRRLVLRRVSTLTEDGFYTALGPYLTQVAASAEITNRWNLAHRATDSWNCDYNLEIRLQTNSTPGEESAELYNVAIWSDGPNQSNELGRGDDIYLAESVFLPLTSRTRN